ncbi:MAG: formate/nitrite transporter family protein [Rhizobiales bacterium]|nr:formate/nitrite transporter family protein [Hyphomicrobiales bacterium]
MDRNPESGLSAAEPRRDPTGLDAFRPAEVAKRIEDAGTGKAALHAMPLAVLSVMAGIFIALGAAAFTAVVTGTDLAYGPTRFIGGLVFSLGLVLVVVAGAELFTGNTLIVLAYVDRKITARAVLRNWAFSFTGNLVGATAIALLMGASGLFAGPVGETARKIALAKVTLEFPEAIVRGILCNMMVCLAVWLTFAARSVTDKILAILLPISGFVLLGYEHSIANMYLIAAGYVAGADITLGGYLHNLVPVTIGNVIGGAGGVALTYRLAYGPPK